MPSKLRWFLPGSNLLLALVVNPWTVGALLSPDGRFESRGVIAVILLGELALVALAALTIRWGQRPWVGNLNLLVWTVVLGIPLIGEATIRVGIALKIPRLRDPGLYANYYTDDDYWILQQRWDPLSRHAPPENVHSLLGWSQESISGSNPHGLNPIPRQRMSSSEPKLYFFGDSFVPGVADSAYELPEYLDARLPGIEVVDLSVRGFGLDQIYLMFDTMREEIAGSPVLVGILVDEDLDRTAQSMRTTQKPFFLPGSDGSLSLRGVPIDRDQEGFFRTRALRRKSFLVSLVRARFGTDFRIEHKKRISRALLERFVAMADSVKSELVFVLFHMRPGLRRELWQAAFLDSVLTRAGRNVFDTKPVLLEFLARSGTQLDSLYKTGDGHHNNLGNQVIGDALLAMVHARGLIPPANKRGPAWE